MEFADHPADPAEYLPGQGWSGITEDEQDTAKMLQTLLNNDFHDVRPALVRARLNGLEVALVCAAQVPKGVDPDEEVDFWPVAILLTEPEHIDMLHLPAQEVTNDA